MENLEQLGDDELRTLIAQKKEELKPYEQEVLARFHRRADVVSQRLARNEKFSPEELRYSAYARCECGSGLAYPKDSGMHGAWYCAAILTHTAQHDGSIYPFAFYDITSEDQPSAQGCTTRPKS